MDCTFKNIPMQFTSSVNDFQQNMFSLTMERSNFLNSLKRGNGGALSVSSQVQNSQLTVSHCKFTQNSAVSDEDEAGTFGGAIFIEASSLDLTIQHTPFTDNKATASGTAVYASSGVTVSVYNCSF